MYRGHGITYSSVTDADVSFASLTIVISCRIVIIGV